MTMCESSFSLSLPFRSRLIARSSHLRFPSDLTAPPLTLRYELQRRLDADPALSTISVLGVDPGGMISNLTRRGSTTMVLFMTWVAPLFVGVSTWLSPNGKLRATSKSAADVLRAAFDTARLGERPKAVYLNGSERGDTGVEAKDPAKGRQLWEASVGYAALKSGDTILSNWK